AQWNKGQDVEKKHIEKRLKNLIRDFDAPFDLQRMLVELKSRARLLHEEDRRVFESETGLATISAWDQLVATLATVFENNNIPVTSARSSRAKNPQPSRFAVCVRTIMDTLPLTASENTDSWRATAKATAKSLEKLKQAETQLASPSTKNRIANPHCGSDECGGLPNRSRHFRDVFV